MGNNKNILCGYNSEENAYKVDDYPYGYTLRTSIYYWIETKPRKGDRFCHYTINPKNGRKNKPKCSNYSTFLYMYINEAGHVVHGVLNLSYLDRFEEQFNAVVSDIGIDNITVDQQLNIRRTYVTCVAAEAPYQLAKYPEDTKHDFQDWIKGKLAHIAKCDFKDLVSYPAKPVLENTPLS